MRLTPFARFRLVLLLVSVLVPGAVGWPVRADDPPPKKEPEKQPEPDEQYQREAEGVAAQIEVEHLVGEKWVKVQRIEKPLLYYGDATRENDRGSVWGWGETSRPVAVLELFQNANDRDNWVYTICNTSGGKVRARRGGEAWWRENESATVLTDVPGAAAPAPEAPARQRQLKQLAGKFTGHQFWDPNNTRYELRRLERPLRTYKDEDAGILDGALYTLANGTNPEILLFIEARVNPKDKSKPVWQYAVGRTSHAELHLEYDTKEVFTSPRADKLSGWDKPYWLGLIKTARKPGK
jgi:hypothetical protein